MKATVALCHPPLEASRENHVAAFGLAIFRRQLRPALPIVAINMAIALMLLWLVASGRHGNTRTSDQLEIGWWLLVFVGLPAALCLGILCGAEEEEGKTAEFALRLPVSRTRIFLEKAGASLFALALFFAAGALGMVVWSLLAIQKVHVPDLLVEKAAGMTAWIALVHASAMMAGVLFRRLLVGLVGGVVLATGSGLTLSRFTDARHKFYFKTPDHALAYWAFFATATVMALIGWARFIRREGR